MKKLWFMLAAALAAGGTASAANPFRDVPADSWAYQAVSTLSDRGLVEGYPDGTFRGEQAITRYEMAQITARLMAKEDQYGAEERALIDRLAAEYAEELDSLGVAVAELERKTGQISWSGDSRMRYKEDTRGKGTWDGRVRITAQGAVNDSTTVTGRFSSGNVNFKKDSGGKVRMDRLNVRHDFGDAAVVLGRYELDMGTQATWLQGSAFDGAEGQLALGADSFLRFGFGRFSDAIPADPTGTFHKVDAFYAQAKTDLHGAQLGVDYFRTAGFMEDGSRRSANVIGGNLTIPVGNFRVFGDYYRDTKGPGEPRIWAAGAGYGTADRKKPGSFGVDVGYYDVEKGLYHQYMSGLDIDDSVFLQDGHFWLATGTVTLMPNVMLHGEWAFAYTPEGSGSKELSDAWELSLVYKF